VEAVGAVSLIRMAAANLAGEPWQRPSDACLVQVGLDALLVGVEAPSFFLPAGLARGEYPQARGLFGLVLQELGLLPPVSQDLGGARWTAAWWWAGQIVACRLDPGRGAKLIHEEAAAELGYPDALQPVVDLARAPGLLDSRPPHQPPLGDRVTFAARDLLATQAHPGHSL
jgi:hypothetical protein